MAKKLLKLPKAQMGGGPNLSKIGPATGKQSPSGASSSQGKSVIRKMNEKKEMDTVWNTGRSTSENKTIAAQDSTRSYNQKHAFDKKKNGGSTKSKKK